MSWINSLTVTDVLRGPRCGFYSNKGGKKRYISKKQVASIKKRLNPKRLATCRRASKKKSTKKKHRKKQEKKVQTAPIKEDFKKEFEAKLNEFKHDSDIVVTIGNDDVTFGDLKRLLPGNWLQTDIINAYFHLLASKSDKTFFHNTYLYQKLTQSNKNDGITFANKVDKKQKIDISKLEQIFIPVNIDNAHWVLVVVNIKTHGIHLYDSLYKSSKSHEVVFDNVERYLNNNLKTNSLATVTWTRDTVQDIVRQKNQNDCGIFILLFAKCISGQHINNIQANSIVDTSKLRYQIGVELIRTRLV